MENIKEAFLASMKQFVDGKGVVVTIKDTDTNAWVEKRIEDNALIYKFVVEGKGGIEISSSVWNDSYLFNGDLINSVAQIMENYDYHKKIWEEIRRA